MRRSSSSCALRYIDSFCSSSSIVAMPSDAKWVQLAKKVAAGTASDDEVCSFQLHFAVLKKLPSDFVATAYENAAHAYRAISSTSKPETQQWVKNTYVSEKRKVLSALATYFAQKEVSAAVAEEPMPHSFLHQLRRLCPRQCLGRLGQAWGGLGKAWGMYAL